MKCLDLSYGSIRGACKSFTRAPLGRSSHCVVNMVHSCKPGLKEAKHQVCSVQSFKHLQHCSELPTLARQTLNLLITYFINNCFNISNYSEELSVYRKAPLPELDMYIDNGTCA